MIALTKTTGVLFRFILYIIVFISPQFSRAQSTTIRHYLYVAVPGIRDYLGYGGHGLLVFDMDSGYHFVKRIETKGFHPDNTPSNVKGIAVSVPLNSIYISTIESLQRIDLTTDNVIWEKFFDGGCDRMSISPDGKTMFLPSFEKNFWNVVDCATGDIITKIEVNRRAHNTIYGPSGNFVYLDDIASRWVYIVNAKTNSIINKIGPFENFVRPFTINGNESRIYVTVDSLLGFEVGDIQSGKEIARLDVKGWNAGPVRRHGNPSHGIALTADEKEIWLADGYNMRVHIFSALPPYQQLTTIPLRDMPGWITFSIDGKYCYPSSGEVIDVRTRKIITTLQDEFFDNVESEKMVEIDFENNKAIEAGDQFGIGRVRN